MLKYEELVWLCKHSPHNYDQQLRDFVLLIAQDHPEVFSATIKRVEAGETEPVNITLHFGPPEGLLGLK